MPGSGRIAIRFLLNSPNTVAAGDSFAVALYHQAGASAAGEIALTVFLDADFNPYNGNEIAAASAPLPRTGTSAIGFNNLSANVDAAVIPPGTYAIGARVTDGARTRYLYAPQLLVITPSRQTPRIDGGSIARNGGVFQCEVRGFPGQTVTMDASNDLVNWSPLQAHTFIGTTWEFSDANTGSLAQKFYRARLTP